MAANTRSRPSFTAPCGSPTVGRWEAVGDVGFDLDQIGVDAEHGGGGDAGEHARRYDGTTE